MSANAEMLHLYWGIGRMVAAKQDAEGWGVAVIPRLAVDLNNDLPGIKGCSERSMRRMIQFYKEYPRLFLIRPLPVAKFEPGDSTQPAQRTAETQITQQVVAQLPWAHNVILIQKLKDLPTRYWYARQAIAQGWSRDTLALMIWWCRVFPARIVPSGWRICGPEKQSAAVIAIDESVISSKSWISPRGVRPGYQRFLRQLKRTGLRHRSLIQTTIAAIS